MRTKDLRWLPRMGDHALARRYWADKEWKKWAVDVVAGSERKPTFGRTVYARARTAEAAIGCAKRNMHQIPRGARFEARLAGPHELGCTATPAAGDAS